MFFGHTLLLHEKECDEPKEHLRRRLEPGSSGARVVDVSLKNVSGVLFYPVWLVCYYSHKSKVLVVEPSR